MTSEGMSARMLLCDAAQVQGGKLYVLGGGWSRVLKLVPLQLTLAIQLVVPWHSANKPMVLVISLLDSDGNPVPTSTGQPMQVIGQMEVGRPPGLKPGTPLDQTLAIPIGPLDLPGGVYRWDLQLDGELLESVPFEVVTAPPGMIIAPTGQST